MKLSVIERLNLQGILPEKGSYTNLKLVRVARETLSFTEAENKVLKFSAETVGNQQVSKWNQMHLVDKTTNKVIAGDKEKIEELIMSDPGNYEMRPTVGEVTIKLGEVVTLMIVKILKDLEDKEELEDKHFTLYEKFVNPADLKLVESQPKPIA